MVPLKTFELRAGYRVEMLTGAATIEGIHADNGGGYAVDLRYDNGDTYTVRNAGSNNVWTVDLRS